MTELVASVRLKADGSGLVGQANASSAAVQGIGKAAVSAGADARTLAAGTAAAEVSARGLAASAGAADRAVDGLGAAAKSLANDQRQAAASIGVLEGRIGSSNTAFRVGTAEANRYAFGARNAGQQVGDFFLQVQLGGGVVRAFTSQAGQLGYALSEMGGKAGKVGAFLTGPWGIALTVAASAAAPFVEKLFETAKAAEQAEVASSNLGDAENQLAAIFGKASSKIAEQNQLLTLNARIKAGNLRLEAAEQARDATKAFATAGTGYAPAAGAATVAGIFGAANYLTGNRSTTNDAVAKLAERARQANALKDVTAQTQAFDAILLDSRKTDFARSPIDRKAFEEAISKASASRANIRFADGIDRSLTTGTIDPLLAKPDRTRTPRPKSTAARDEFGRDAADKLAGLTDQFDQTPPALQRTNRELRQIDDLIDDLNRKKPPGFETLIATAEAAKVTIRRGLIQDVAEAFDKPRTLADQAAAGFRQLDAIAADLEQRKPPNYEALLGDVARARSAIEESLTRPFNEYVEAQEQSLQIGRLVAAGRSDEADALRVINELERGRAPLTVAQKDAVLATTQALAAQERQVERLHRRQQVYLNALSDVQGIVQQTIFDGPKGLASLPGRLADTFKRFASERLTESLFGDVFDKLRDQVTGTTVVETASDRMATAVNEVASHTKGTTGALDGLTRAATSAAQAVSSPGFGQTRDASGIASSDLLARGGAIANGQLGAALDEILVVGKRLPKAPSDPFAGSFGQIATVLGKKIGIDDAKAEKIGSFVGGAASKGLRGAVEGQAASSVAGLLGIKTSSTGASIGGAIGGLTGIPGGSIVGGLLGGVVGGLFGGKPKEYGSSTLSFGDGAATAGGAIGKGTAERETASALGGSVAAGLNQIAAALGAELGSANVSIGYRPGHKAGAYRVDTTGAGRVTGVDAFETEAEAVAFAIRNAIADGAIKTSKAVAAALQSSTDVDKALAEAVKVQQLETLLGGVSGQLTAVFKQADAEAAERVRLAKKYGLDLLQVEKINAEQRADLLDKTLSARVASLKDLQASLTIGDLFEGTAADRRDGIRAELDKAKADADLGKDGATDRVAQLLGQLVTTTKEAYGTAGPELAADRALAGADAARLIKAEEDRVRAAAGEQVATTKAVEAGNALSSEGNDYLAESSQTLRNIEQGIASLVASAKQNPLPTNTPYVPYDPWKTK